MADVRCLLCDHLNDISATRCWYCQAPLPGSISDVFGERSQFPAQKDRFGPPFEDDAPEWLARIRKLAREESLDALPGEGGAGEEGEHHWRQEFPGNGGEEEEGEASSVSDGLSFSGLIEDGEPSQGGDGEKPIEIQEPQESDLVDVPLPEISTGTDESSLAPAPQEDGEAEVEPAHDSVHGVTSAFDGLPDWLRMDYKTEGIRAHPDPTHIRNAGLFRDMLQFHPVASETGRAVAVKPGRRKWGRAMIAVLLILSVIIPMAAHLKPLIIPALFSQEIVDTLNAIEELPADKPVLIAAQFEAGLAGEMSWTLEPVITHLVSRGVPIALVSTNATGYAVLQDTVNQVGGNYPVELKTANLGYLPGGTIGLFSLVKDLPRTIPFAVELTPAWELPALSNVHSLVDFGMVLLVSDNPESARAWVEQSGRIPSAPPLIVIGSAQAAPLIQPYYDSGQVAGYLSGAGGAALYQLLRQVAGKAVNNYSSLQVTLLAAALLVFIGGMMTLMFTPGDKEKTKGGMR